MSLLDERILSSRFYLTALGCESPQISNSSEAGADADGILGSAERSLTLVINPIARHRC